MWFGERFYAVHLFSVLKLCYFVFKGSNVMVEIWMRCITALLSPGQSNTWLKVPYFCGPDQYCRSSTTIFPDLVIVSEVFPLFRGRRGRQREYYSTECSNSWITLSPYRSSWEREIIFTNKLFPEINPLSWNPISFADTGSQSRPKMLTHTLRKWHWSPKLRLWTGPCQLPRYITRLRRGVTQDKSHTCPQAAASRVGVCIHGHAGSK